MDDRHAAGTTMTSDKSSPSGMTTSIRTALECSTNARPAPDLENTHLLRSELGHGRSGRERTNWSCSPAVLPHHHPHPENQVSILRESTQPRRVFLPHSIIMMSSEANILNFCGQASYYSEGGPLGRHKSCLIYLEENRRHGF